MHNLFHLVTVRFCMKILHYYYLHISTFFLIVDLGKKINNITEVEIRIEEKVQKTISLPKEWITLH